MNDMKRYMVILMNDGGLPAMYLTDDLDAAKRIINQAGYVQHYLLKDTQTNEMIMSLDEGQNE